MTFKTIFPILLASATACACAAHAQEAAFDPEKTKALFAGSEWTTGWISYSGEGYKVMFSTYGTVSCVGASGGVPKFSGVWVASGAKTASLDDMTFEMAADGKQLFHTTNKNTFRVLHRGAKVPPADPAIDAYLAQPGIVWVKQASGNRTTVAFASDGDVRVNGSFDREIDGKREIPRWWQEFRWQVTVYKDDPLEAIKQHYFFIPDGKGGFVIRNHKNEVFLPEPRQPADLVPPQTISRAKSPFSGTAWCRVDGKGKMLMLTFAASGTVSDSTIPNEKPEWIPYEDGSVRYNTKDGTRRLTLNADKKLLIREDKKAREV